MCDPNGSLFMNPSEVVNITHNTQAVDVVDVYFTNYYTDKFFNSCKHVQYPKTCYSDISVIDSMCGSDIDVLCTGQKWLTFMGTPQPGSPTPFTMKFIFTNTTTGDDVPTNMSARNATLLRCSDPVNGVACSCRDCPSSCGTIPTIPPDKDSVKVSFIPIGIFVGLIGFVIYDIVFVIVVMVLLTTVGNEREYKKLPKTKMSHRSSLFLASTGQKFENLISELFSWWGYVVAEYWYLVIPVALIVVSVCCVGLKFFEVTTDPVGSWSTPNSVAQKEKEYFDNNFDPFHRTSQIIITAPNSPDFVFHDPTYYQVSCHAGGVFRQNILNEVSIIE